jgi:hypothetical protein
MQRLGRDVDFSPLLEPRVPGHTDVGERGDFLPSQPGRQSSRASRNAGLLGCDGRATCAKKHTKFLTTDGVGTPGGANTRCQLGVFHATAIKNGLARQSCPLTDGRSDPNPRCRVPAGLNSRMDTAVYPARILRVIRQQAGVLTLGIFVRATGSGHPAGTRPAFQNGRLRCANLSMCRDAYANPLELDPCSAEQGEN